jgi:hypothetical protein
MQPRIETSRRRISLLDTEICKMAPDFEYIEDGKWIVEEMPTFRLKLALFRANFPSAQFRIVGMNKRYLGRRARKKALRANS